MTKLTIALVAALSLFACKKKGGADEALAKLTDFKEQICKCGEGDMECAKKVMEAQKAYGEEMKKSGDVDKNDPDLKAKAEPIMKEYMVCMKKAMSPKAGDTPAAPPAAATTPAAAPEKKDEPKADDKKPEEKKEGGGGW